MSRALVLLVLAAALLGYMAAFYILVVSEDARQLERNAVLEPGIRHCQ